MIAQFLLNRLPVFLGKSPCFPPERRCGCWSTSPPSPISVLRIAVRGERWSSGASFCTECGSKAPNSKWSSKEELASAAGFDPDAGIKRPGQRSMPAWCMFHDAARAEHMAREAACTATQIAAIAPQAAEFQNSPLKIFGQHDEAAVVQMRNCMSVGNVVAGVICDI